MTKSKKLLQMERDWEALLFALDHADARRNAALRASYKVYGYSQGQYRYCIGKPNGLWRKHVAAMNHWDRKFNRLFGALVSLFVAMREECSHDEILQTTANA